MRGLAPGLAALNDQDSQSLLAKGNGEREPYDAAADDDRVPGFHTQIVKDSIENCR
jgi:hypothetical protein